MKKTELPVERKEPGCNGQYYVTVHNQREWALLLNILDEHRFNGSDGVSKRNCPEFPPALVVDKKRREYFLASVSCLACAASRGHNAISFEKFRKLAEKGELSAHKT